MQSFLSAIKEFILTLNWVDYIIVIAFLRGAFVGYHSGLLSELLIVFTYGSAIVGAIGFSPFLGQLIEKQLPVEGMVANTAAAFIVFIIIFLVFRLASVILLKLAPPGEGSLLRLVGLFIGVIRWAVILSALFMFVDRTHITIIHEDIIYKSRFAQPLLPIAPTTVEYLSSILPASSEFSFSGELE